MLKEYEEKGRAGGVVDRRFGENDPTMSLEERMLERFTKERQRASKGAAFNLEDEEELTHYGQSLSKLDDFDNIGLGLDDDEEDRGMHPTFIFIGNKISTSIHSQGKLTPTLSRRRTLGDSATMKAVRRMRFVILSSGISGCSETCFPACKEEIQGRGYGRGYG